MVQDCAADRMTASYCQADSRYVLSHSQARHLFVRWQTPGASVNVWDANIWDKAHGHPYSYDQNPAGQASSCRDQGNQRDAALSQAAVVAARNVAHVVVKARQSAYTLAEVKDEQTGGVVVCPALARR